MSEHTNETIIRRFYDAFSSGDAATLQELSTEGIVWNTPGSSRVSGEHRGRGPVFAVFQLCGELTQGRMGLELEELEVQDDGTVVTVHRLTAEREGRGKLDIRETETWTIEDGKVARVDEAVSDPAAADAFWS